VSIAGEAEERSGRGAEQWDSGRQRVSIAGEAEERSERGAEQWDSERGAEG
jgi:hypothetical protein